MLRLVTSHILRSTIIIFYHSQRIKENRRGCYSVQEEGNLLKQVFGRTSQDI